MYKAQHDKRAREISCNIRDQVWLDTKKTDVGLSRKLCNKWQGTYHITEVKGSSTYRLRRCSDDVPNKVLINVNRLKKFYDSQDRPTNNVEVPTDDEMSDDEDNEEENAQDAEETVQTVIQPDSTEPVRNDTRVQRHTNDDRKNEDSDLCLVERIVKAKCINKNAL
ncbi:unnamed protein product [Mytilus coruscus]|uniref:Uncharacterized protein n=1 Tax=Mytilus coruscus TaxID=42192 RepID=A0A6J8A274_MYTCO|nr:unnamed protein product [Mytilus coruscus]